MCDVPGIAACVVKLLNVFLAWLPDFSLNLCYSSGGSSFYWLLLLLLLFNTAYYISCEFVGSSTCFDAGRPSSLQEYGDYRRSVVGPLSEASRRGVLQVEPM